MKLQLLLSICLLSTSFPALAVTLPYDKDAMDTKANPCEDFYQYACGGWIKKTELPADKPTWVRGFNEVELRNQELLKHMFEEFADGKFEPSVPYAKQMGTFYAACMDEKGIEKNARGQFVKEIAPITTLESVEKLAPVLADLHLKGISALFAFSNSQDLKNSELMIGDVDQGGTNLPSREYYLKDTPEMKKVQNAYLELAEHALKIVGYKDEDAKARAAAILAFETKLAKASLNPDERRDPEKLYHRLELKGLKKSTPKLDWQAYFLALGLPKLTKINVDVPKFFSDLNKTLSEVSLEDLKAYLIVHTFMDYAGALDKESVNAHFKYGQVVLGMKELPPRWKRCVDSVGGAMNMAVGHAFVDKTFGAEGKKIAQEMMHEVEHAMKQRLESVAWMDAGTRKTAVAKLLAAKNSMGFPDKWRSYDGLAVTRDSYLQNAMAAGVFDSHFQLNKIGQPVDRDEWDMAPFIVNAENMPTINQMRFPAGILQPPNFESHRESAANYGAIGMVMGHELTHGYDDEGRKFDKRGNMKDWWSKKTAKEFESRTACLVSQYNDYIVDGDVHVNGKLSLGENIADQGGEKLSYTAWQNALKSSPTERPDLKSDNNAQTYFLSFAQLWCAKETPEYQRHHARTNPHPAPRFRVNGVVSDDTNFADAFSCKAGDKMVRQNRCEVW
jgi:endothelin-converting enzyme/putative endopeptidase